MTTLHRLSFMSEDNGYQLQMGGYRVKEIPYTYLHIYRVFADGPGNTRDGR